MRKKCIVSLCILYLCCFWFGCKNHSQENENIDVIPIDLSQIQEISFFDVFSEVDIIPLETNKDVLIQSVEKAILHNNCYYILDDEQAKIFVFDLKGNYISQIGNRGKGPGEYQGFRI
ncbi:MAG: 6-bladed beta-propeller [Bacteroidales bacterium]|nr:6-bladed beta-propeller [Bacteroidales bacterium]